MKTLTVFNQEGKKIDKIKLDIKVFDGKINQTLLHQAVVTYLANQRQGLASTKTRGMARGGGRKPWRQKGTGRARVGSIRSPIWRGGGVSFGPHKRDYFKKMPHRMKAFALKSALNAKLQDEEIVVIDRIKLSSFKTKDLFKILNNLKLSDQKTKLVVENIDGNLKMASRNLKKLSIEKALELHTYSILDSKKLVFTQGSLKLLQERIKKCLP